VSQQDKSKSYRRIFLKFCGYVGHGINYKGFNFGHDPAGILDSGSPWNFRYHCAKGGIREPLQNRRWWRHLTNNIALAEVPAGYDCFLVFNSRGCAFLGTGFSCFVVFFYRLKTQSDRFSNIFSVHDWQHLQIQLELGHVAILRPQVTSDGHTHDWELYLRPPAESASSSCVDALHFIERVEFQLHETYAQSTVGRFSV